MHKRRTPTKRIATIPGFSDEQKAADELGLVVRTLRSWRRQGKGPAWVKIGKAIYYPDEQRLAWVRSGVINPVREQVA